MTEHIQRFATLNDNDFIKQVKYYRKFNNVSDIDHVKNLEYINARLQKHGLVLSSGCCKKYYLQQL